MHLRAVSAKLLDTAHSMVLKVSDSAQDYSPGHYWEKADRKTEHAVQSLLADTKSITTSSENLIALQEEAHEGMEAIKDVEVAENDNLLPVMKHGSCTRVTLGPHLPEIQLTTVPGQRDRTKNFRELKKPTGQQEAQDMTSQLELFNELKSTLSSQSLPVKKWLIKELLAGMPHDAVKEIMESARRNLEVSDIESQTRPERKQMFWTMIFSISATIASHAALFLLSWKFGAKEGKCTSGEETATCRKWVNWLIVKVVSPALLLTLLGLARVYLIDWEERRDPRPLYSGNNLVNLLDNSVSKMIFFAIKEMLAAGVGALLCAHLASLFIDILGALFLWWKGGYHDPDVADS